MIIQIYKYFSNLIFLPILLYFIVRIVLSKETVDSVFEKFCLKKINRPKGKLVWINGVSIGEAKSALTVAEEILKNNPNTIILFSTSTITAYKTISKLKKEFILIYSPIDINFVIKKFLNKWKPDKTIFLESEIWPNIIFELNKRNINFTILNGRISEKSFFFWKKISFFSHKIFSKVNNCFVQDKKSRTRFKSLGVLNTKISPNLKFITKEQPINKKDYNFLKNKLNKKTIITLFSSHEEEELILIDCYNYLKKNYSNLFFIVIPRHLHKKQKIISNLQKYKIKFDLRSKNKQNIDDKSFYIADTYGELNLFFKLSTIAVTGGSFKKVGGHNPIELYHYNCLLIFGPEMFNFEEIKKKIIEANAGFEVKGFKELAKK